MRRLHSEVVWSSVSMGCRRGPTIGAQTWTRAKTHKTPTPGEQTTGRRQQKQQTRDNSHWTIEHLGLFSESARPLVRVCICSIAVTSSRAHDCDPSPSSVHEAGGLFGTIPCTLFRVGFVSAISDIFVRVPGTLSFARLQLFAWFSRDY